MIGDMTIDFNQQHNAPTFPLTATGHDTPYYAHGRSTPMVQQQQQQQQQQEEGRDIQPMPMIAHTSTMSPHHGTMNQQHAPSILSLPASSSTTGEYVDNDTDSQAYCNYLYQFGFLQGDFSDITVSIPNIGQTFSLHSLIICRSPYFYQRLIHLQHQQRGTRLMLELDYKPVMVESFRVALTHLYRPLSRQEMIRMTNENPCLTLELIGIAEYLGLTMLKDGLIHVALSQDFDQTSAMQWIHCLHTRSSSQPQLWIHALENRLLLYLARDLPAQIVTFPATLVNMTIGKHHTRGYMPSKTTSLPGMMDLAQLYSMLPWTYVIRCLEHPDLPVQDTLQRYCLAQKISELKSSATMSHEHFTFGLRFSNNGKQHLQPGHSPSNNNDVTGLSFNKATPRKLGKWDPTLYEFNLAEGDDRRFVVL